jgi:hypothetical protein
LTANRLGQELEGSVFHCANSHGNVAVAGDDACVARLPLQIEAAHHIRACAGLP